MRDKRGESNEKIISWLGREIKGVRYEEGRMTVGEEDGRNRKIEDGGTEKVE